MLDDQQFINMGKTLEGSFSTTKSTHNVLLSMPDEITTTTWRRPDTDSRDLTSYLFCAISRYSSRNRLAQHRKGQERELWTGLTEKSSEKPPESHPVHPCQAPKKHLPSQDIRLVETPGHVPIEHGPGTLEEHSPRDPDSKYDTRRAHEARKSSLVRRE